MMPMTKQRLDIPLKLKSVSDSGEFEGYGSVFGVKFMMNNNSLFAVRILKDSEGNYLWRPGLELGQPSSLAGYGVAENEQMPDIAADAKAIAFGNFKRGYTIVDRIGTRILRDPYTNKPFVGFYTTKRTGGMLADSQAIKLLQIGAGA